VSQMVLDTTAIIPNERHRLFSPFMIGDVDASPLDGVDSATGLQDDHHFKRRNYGLQACCCRRYGNRICPRH
jgi:hypothetical protein